MTTKGRTLITLALILLVASPSMVAAGWNEGVAALKGGDYAKAEAEFKAIVDSKPDWPGGHYMLGWTYIKRDKSREAITHLRKAYELDSDNPAYQLRLGEAYVAAGRYADAVGFLEKVNAGALPKEQQAFLTELKAVAYAKSGQDGAALAQFKQAAAAKPTDASAQYQYGTRSYNAGDTAEAVRALEKATKIAPDNADYQSAYAKALSRQGRESPGAAKFTAYRKAVTAAQVVVRKSPSYDNLMLLAEAQLGAKDYKGAVDNFEAAASKSSGAWLPHYYIGQAHTATQQYRSAEASLKQSLDKASASADKQRIWRQLGFVYEKQKKYDDAILAYNQAGDSGGATRAKENRDTDQYNKDVEAQNAEAARKAAEAEAIKQQLKELPGGPPPRF